MNSASNKTISHGGGYTLNTQPAATLNELQSKLQGALSGRPEELKGVFLKASRALNYGEIVKVIGVMKVAGCAPIGLQVEALDQ
jgi:biopolymer transport protein ExbD